jgi:hypothetical protein
VDSSALKVKAIIHFEAAGIASRNDSGASQKTEILKIGNIRSVLQLVTGHRMIGHWAFA